MSKNKTKRAAAPEIETVFSSVGMSEESVEAGGSGDLKSKLKKKLLYPITGIALLVLIGTGVMAKNGWLPATDALTGKKTGWFGAALPRNAASSWNPFAAPLPTPTPQLSKEYIYAGSRLLAVEDANANAAPPADLAVWRPSSGEWWVMGGTGSTQTTVSWGASTDKEAPGDYDGDGKTDFAVFRASAGTWYVVKSSAGDNSQTYYYMGATNDLVASADYDGDGKTDPALFRPSTGVWYIQKSTTNQTISVQYGQSGDVPAPGDYDGDGKADIAFFRSGTTTKFYVYRSSDSTSQEITYGASGDSPVVADYDGDGRADPAVRRGNDWYILQSSTNSSATISSFGVSGDKAVQNDYDADGKVDIAVWRNSNGNWYIRQSTRLGQTDEVRTVQWGASGDIPVPAFYRR